MSTARPKPASAPQVARALAPSIDDFAFLIGRWTAVQTADAVEEVWSRVGTWTLMGMFCWAPENGPVVYESLVIEHQPQRTTLTLRSFSGPPGASTPVDLPVLWRVVRFSPGEVVFEGATRAGTSRLDYRLLRPGRLYASLNRAGLDTGRISSYQFERAPLGPLVSRMDMSQ